MDQLGIRALYPAPRRCIDLVGKDRHDHRDRDVLDVEKALLCRRSDVPIEASRRDRRVRQPVHHDVLEDIVSSEAFALSVADARDPSVTARIAVEYTL